MAQFLTIHGELDEDFAMPLIYCLLPNKTKAIYRQIFQWLKRELPELDSPRSKLKRFVCDFERGLMSAVRLGNFHCSHGV